MQDPHEANYKPRMKEFNLINLFISSLFIYLERAHPQAGEGQIGREKESQTGCAMSAQSLIWGSNSQTV